MEDDSTSSTSIAELIGRFESKDGSIRMRAREELVRRNEAGVPNLIKALGHSSERVRWESAKTLRGICSPAAADALVEALQDETQAISWAAAEALVALGETAVQPLLLGLERHSDSVWFRHGAYHVLHTLARDGKLPAAATNVLHTLREIEPGSTVPFAAKKALDEMSHPKSSPKTTPS